MVKKTKLVKCFLTSVSLAIFLLFLFSLTSCEGTPIADDEIINNLLPNGWVFLAHIIAVIILIVIIVCFLWKPFKKLLSKRYDYIAEQILDAEQNKKMSMVELQKANQIKINALSEATNITNDAKLKADNIIKKAKDDAELKKNEIILDAKKDVEKQKSIAKIDAKNKIVNIACNVASSILKRKVTKKDNDKFIDDILEEIDKGINRK